MNKNEKADALESIGSNTPINELITMPNTTPKKNKFQLDLFVTERPKKTLEIIHCCDCHKPRLLDGYRFKLMPLCSDCRTEMDLDVLKKRIERRQKR